MLNGLSMARRSPVCVKVNTTIPCILHKLQLKILHNIIIVMKNAGLCQAHTEHKNTFFYCEIHNN